MSRLSYRWLSRYAAPSGWLGVAAALSLLVASAALAGTSYTDPPNDANEAPDITSVTVAFTPGATVTVRVAVGNFQSLPADAAILVSFDLDSNAATGASGDELAAAYRGDGALDVQRWNGIQLAPGASGMSSAFADGVLTLTIPDVEVGEGSGFGVRVVAARTQMVGLARIISADIAPASGEATFAGSGTLSFSDPTGDQGGAPDVTRVAVSDTANGMVSFRIEAPNFRADAQDKLFGIDVDLAGRPQSSDEVFLTYLTSRGGAVEIEREIGGRALPDKAPHRATATSEDGSIVVSVHRSELDDASSFGFSVVTADLVARGEADGLGQPGDIEAVDVAPDGVFSGQLYLYRLSNRPPLHLELGDPVGVPARPRSGRPFTVRVEVRRSDTFASVRSGSVRCSVNVRGRRVSSSGSFDDGRAVCRLVVPAGTGPARIRGVMTVRASGESARSRFAFPR